MSRIALEIVDQTVTERKLAVVKAAQEGLIPPVANDDSDEEEAADAQHSVYRNLMDLALLRVCRKANEEL